MPDTLSQVRAHPDSEFCREVCFARWLATLLPAPLLLLSPLSGSGATHLAPIRAVAADGRRGVRHFWSELASLARGDAALARAARVGRSRSLTVEARSPVLRVAGPSPLRAPSRSLRSQGSRPKMSHHTSSSTAPAGPRARSPEAPPQASPESVHNAAAAESETAAYRQEGSGAQQAGTATAAGPEKPAVIRRGASGYRWYLLLGRLVKDSLSGKAVLVSVSLPGYEGREVWVPEKLTLVASGDEVLVSKWTLDRIVAPKLGSPSIAPKSAGYSKEEGEVE